MVASLMDKIYAKTDAALASGDLQPLVTDESIVDDNGIRFILRWASTLAKKDEIKKVETKNDESNDEPILPGGPRDPDFNPFLKPDPELLVGDIGTEHAIILNKFPVCLHHLVIARKEFAEQQSILELSDFYALANIMSEYGGLGFYNGGAAAGASQRHKHVQWLPAKSDNASLAVWRKDLPKKAKLGLGDPAKVQAKLEDIAHHPLLPIKHCFIPVTAGKGTDPFKSTESMLNAYKLGLSYLELGADPDGLLPAFNMLVSDGWMLMVPRSKEHYLDISINAASFGGTIYVSNKDQIAEIEQQGPIAVLASVGFPS